MYLFRIFKWISIAMILLFIPKKLIKLRHNKCRKHTNKCKTVTMTSSIFVAIELEFVSGRKSLIYSKFSVDLIVFIGILNGFVDKCVFVWLILHFKQAHTRLRATTQSEKKNQSNSALQKFKLVINQCVYVFGFGHLFIFAVCVMI